MKLGFDFLTDQGIGKESHRIGGYLQLAKAKSA